MDIDEARELHDFIFTLMGMFHVKFFRSFRQHCAGNPPLKKNHAKIMGILHRHQPLTPTEIGRMLDVEKGSLTTLIDQLQDWGLVIRRDDPTDRRKSLISLSAQGMEQMNQVSELHAETLRAIFADTDGKEVQQFMDSLRYAAQFMQNLQKGN